MRKFCPLAFGLVLSMLGPLALAGTFSGHADAGYAATSGNSSSSSINVDLGLAYLQGLWTYKGALKGLRQSSDSETTAQNYTAEARAQRALSPRSYAFGDLLYEQDDFSGVRDRTTGTIGYGYKVINTKATKLSLELGVGERRSKFSDDTEATDVIGQAGLHFLQHLSDTTFVTEDILVQSGQANTYLESDTALQVKMIGSLSAKIGYVVKHNSTVPYGVTEKTDTYTTVGLSYAFGTPDAG